MKHIKQIWGGLLSRKLLLVAVLTIAFGVSAKAQVNVSGVVTEASGFGLPGVSVVVQGTTIGVLTGMDGDYTISVPSTSSVLEFSFIGYQTQTITVGNQSTINVVLSEDVQMLDEVVVVGYGTQAKKDITGSVSVVTTEALTQSSSATFAEALQGRSAGVYVSTSGAPGANATIRVRGVGSVNGSDPLVIIDGVSGGSISSVNSNDIESFQVLKDASATAIYGAMGANGVIIITTKQGTKTGQPRVSYNGYVGISTMANKGFDMFDAWELMEFEAEGIRNYHNYRNMAATPAELAHNQFGELKDYTVNADGTWSGGTLTMPFTVVPGGSSVQDILNEFGDGTGDAAKALELLQQNYKEDGSASYALSAYYYNQMILGMSEEEARVGTNWYDLIVQKGIITDHQLSLVGGGDKGQYSLSLSYTGQEGTVKSSYYDRYSIRLNSTFNPRTYITIGANTNTTLTKSQGDRGSNAEGGAFARTYQIKPWVPPYNVSGTFAGSHGDGGYANTALSIVENQKGDWTKSINSQNSIFLEVKPISKLTLRSQVAATFSGSWNRSFSEKTIEWNKEGSTYNSLTEDGRWGMNFQWTNTATYTNSWNDHRLTLVVGSEALDQGFGRNISATRRNYTRPNDENSWVINNGATADQTNGGSQGTRVSMFGYFGRADYSYKDKYLATVTVRRDASSRFSETNRWGTFPSISLGWRVSDESFMDGTDEWLDDLKLRAGYGTTGNSNIGAYNWAFQYGTGANYHYAITGGNNSAYTGYGLSNLGDVNARWETTRMLNVGLDATVFDNRLTLGVDYYIKKTTDMLVSASWSAQAGSATKPNVNVGDMQNNGFDINVDWKDNIGKFSYGIAVNASQYKNEVIELGTSDMIVNLSPRLGNVSITKNGQPIGMFYGYKSLGIYKSVDDVMSYKDSKGNTILPYGVAALEDLDETKAQEFIGRYKLQDVDGDGRIGAGDETIIGNPHPDLTGGINLTAGYGNWDFSAYLYYSLGNDLLKLWTYYTNFGVLGCSYSTDRIANSWNPETNPDGIYPMWLGVSKESPEAMMATVDQVAVEDGSYMRIQTMQIGYTLPKSLLNKLGLTNLRIYGQVSNLYTFTKYSGLDPEILSSSDLRKGFDYGGYGMPRQFILGVNLTF